MGLGCTCLWLEGNGGMVKTLGTPTECDMGAQEFSWEGKDEPPLQSF